MGAERPWAWGGVATVMRLRGRLVASVGFTDTKLHGSSTACAGVSNSRIQQGSDSGSSMRIDRHCSVAL